MTVDVKARRFDRALDLETDERFQVAPFTDRARAHILMRPFEAWAVWAPRWDRQVATIVRFEAPDWNRGRPGMVISTAPHRVMLDRYDRVLLLWQGGIQTYAAADTAAAWNAIAEALAEDEMADIIAAAAERSGVPVEDFEGLAKVGARQP